MRQQLEDGPWKSLDQLRLFYKALVKALPTVANVRNADAVAKKIISDLATGMPNSYWEDFESGVAIGTSTKPDWEAEPGIPYPMFVNYGRSVVMERKRTLRL